METKKVSEKLKNGEEHTSKNNCIGNNKKSKKKNKTKLNNNKIDENVESVVIKPETTVDELNIKLEERLHITKKKWSVNGLVNGDDSDIMKNGENVSANKENNDVVRICKTSDNGLCISSKFVGDSEISENSEICKTKHKQNDLNAQTICPNPNLIVDEISIEYKEYQSELQMPDIMRLIQKDLSEPYSIYTYRYFIHNWPKLCFLAMHNDLCVGAIVCKLDVHRQTVRRGYIAMLAVDKDFRKLKIGTNLVQKAIQVSHFMFVILSFFDPTCTLNYSQMGIQSFNNDNFSIKGRCSV